MHTMVCLMEGAAALRRHEIVGIVTEVGSGVTEFKVGDRAGIGCFVRACRECNQCKKGTDQYCSKMVRCHMHPTNHVPREMLAPPACGPTMYLCKCSCRRVSAVEQRCISIFSSNAVMLEGWWVQAWPNTLT